MEGCRNRSLGIRVSSELIGQVEMGRSRGAGEYSDHPFASELAAWELPSLPDRDRRALRDHIQSCDRCRRRIEMLERLRSEGHVFT